MHFELVIQTTTYKGEISLNAEGERLLQELLNKEQSLMAELEESKLQAEKILEEAQQKAQNARANSKEEIEKLSANLAEKTKASSDELRANILDLAEKEIKELRTKAKKRLPAAVKLVMERIIA